MLKKIKTKIENKMLQGFLSILLKRIKSKSPKFYVALRYICGGVLVIFSLIIGILKVNTFGISEDTVKHTISGLLYVGSVIGGVWGTTFTGTVDMTLLHPEEQPSEDVTPSKN